MTQDEPLTAAIAFDIHLDPDAAAEVERQFFLQAALRLRRWRTFLPPVACALFLAVSVALKQPAAFSIVWAALLVLGIGSQAMIYFMRPGAVRRDVRAVPDRRIELHEEMMQMRRGDKIARVAWSRVEHVWQMAGHELLVVGPFLAIALPLKDLPPGAHEFILAHAGR
jgi:hypothetical protein